MSTWTQRARSPACVAVDRRVVKTPYAFAALAFVFASACATAPESTPAPKAPDAANAAVMPPAQADACKASTHTGLVGKPATDSDVPPPSNLVRHIRPDSIVTMEYVFARLNIEIDTQGIITAVRCG